MPNNGLDWLPSPSQHFLVVAVALLVYVLTTRARREHRAPTTAIAWVMALLLMPYVMLPMYLLFGQRKLRPAGHVRLPRTGAHGHWAAELIESFDLAPPSACDIRMHADGVAARDALWEVIEGARTRLDIGTFIIGNDPFGHDVLERLARRSRDGVQVRVLLDGFGALQLPRGHFAELRAAGVQVSVFRPVFSLRRTGPRNLRNHRKLAVADNVWLWSGGRNLAGEYFCGNAAHPQAWRDLSFDLRGGAALAAARQFEQDWASASGRIVQSLDAPAPMPPGEHMAQYLPSGPDQTEDTAMALLIDACFRAEHRLLAITPYFVPSDGLRDALRLAARRGVQVTIAIPQKSNHPLADFVRTRAMRDLARAGVIFRMLPFMAHAKAVVMDDSLALCGSINLDGRSLLLNHESAVVFYDEQQIEWLAQWIESTASAGETFRARTPGLGRDIAEGLVLTLAFQL
ncbi:phospholipase D-like domain-containing protein [Variovorax dokdonensis]|uniref:Phospholipase D-like domain-containing protein n=1 Tax=Variovorax dokdonensis TaxID=344883 RepID=A0ABT7NEP6_9BURK|nr:phospholipase D-like domain-containing protein [Variovorax dokdonensis]MDM0046387.1 phospholipase D-like domain-containing protein [Variovorax dokdonensis]